MTLKVQHKRSAVASKAPLPADLEYGEIAVNYEKTDPALYIKDSDNVVRKIGTQPAATETAAGIVELATAAETTTGTDATRAVHPAGLKVELDKKANLVSPTFTGTPAAPTAAVGTNTTQVATTAFVHAADKWTRTGTTLAPAVATDTIQGQLVPTNGALGSRNVIINGELKINQRGVTLAAAAVGSYGPDRWKKVDATNMTQVVEDVSFTPGAKYTLSWKGGTPQVLTAPATGHWTLPNIPITATEVQLEMGEVATPFERRPIGLELSLCLRYCQVGPVGRVGTCGYSGDLIVTIEEPTLIPPGRTITATPPLTAMTLTISNAGVTSVNVNGAGPVSVASAADGHILRITQVAPGGVNANGLSGRCSMTPAKYILSAEIN